MHPLNRKPALVPTPSLASQRTVRGLRWQRRQLVRQYLRHPQGLGEIHCRSDRQKSRALSRSVIQKEDHRWPMS